MPEQNIDEFHPEYLYYTEADPTNQFELGPAKPGDVGMDFPARIYRSGLLSVTDIYRRDITDQCVDYDKLTVEIPPGCYASLPSGLFLKVPDNCWYMVRPRSSTGWKRGLWVFEGTIDQGYRGELACLIYNPTCLTATIRDGDRLAQIIVVQQVIIPQIKHVDKLPETERGATGFGSSGA